MKLSKECKSLKAAERYQNSLYNRFWYVQLIQAPRFTEAGNYIWDCRENDSKTISIGKLAGEEG